MSSVLFVEPILFGADPNITDNKFIESAVVDKEQADKDQALAAQLLLDLHNRIQAKGVSTTILRLADDPRGSSVYANNGDAIFPNNSISFHNFTDTEGKITRRLVVLYPMSRYRRGELPQVQLLDKLEVAAKEGTIELLDLRSFEEKDRSLEGTGAMNFSHDGSYVYMSRSGRTDDEVLDILCSRENLNIPKERRFLFSSAVQNKDGGEDLIYHTNVIGWCGRGICAWALDLLKFDTEAECERFHAHLRSFYKVVIHLTQEEIGFFAGNACELAGRTRDGAECRFLCISSTAWDNMSAKNRQALESWYGTDNILPFNGEVLERRSGGSIRCSMGASVVAGSCAPSSGQATTLQVAHVIDKA